MLTQPNLRLPHIHQVEVGVGLLEQRGERLRFVNAPTSDSVYTNAQIDDYDGLPRRGFPWQPRPGAPVVLSLRARFSHERLAGTAGFGFWNDPSMTGGGTGLKRAPALPKAIWFFYASPESNMALAMDMPGYGWKAQTFDAQRPLFYALAPTAPVALLLMRVPLFYRRLWPVGQRAIGVSEAMIGRRRTDDRRRGLAGEGEMAGEQTTDGLGQPPGDRRERLVEQEDEPVGNAVVDRRSSVADTTAWHAYRIEWGVARARFFVDERCVLDCDTSPKGPLGLVIWLDNQAMVLTPQGEVRHALLASGCEQWMEVEGLRIEQA